jgi:ATP-dependent protease HslVU (ClpYQ) peptidase subunit
MTTLVAAAQDDLIVMAADTMTNVYDRPIIGGAKKIRRLKVGGSPNALVGFAGCGGLVAAATHITIDETPDPTDDVACQEWAMQVAVQLNRWAVETGITQDGRMDGSVLLGWHGRLWTCSEVQAIPHPDGRAALGSGEGPAIGALDAFLACGKPLGEAVLAAAQVGVSRCRYSEAPIQVELLDAKVTD